MAMTIIPHVALETETFPNGELEVMKLEGREAIGQLFQYEILAVCRDPSGVEPEELCGQEAAIVYSRDGRDVRRVYGMIAVVSDRLETETEHSTYRLTFVPRAYRLTLVETLDVFLDTTVPDVIRQKMKDAGFQEKDPKADAGAGSANQPLGKGAAKHDFELRLYDDYPVRDFVVQYKETDLAFIQRLCEHLGVSFFFEHQAGRDVMVFTDVNEGFRPIEGGPELPFRARGEHTGVWSFEETIRMIPAQYVVRDYNYRMPQVTLTGQAQVPTGLGSVVEYGSHVKTPDEAEKLAHVRAQERMAQRRVYEGESDAPEIVPGAKMTLAGHPRGDTKLLVTEVKVRAEQVTLGVAIVKEAFFRADFKAISETRRYRPPRVTPKPRIHGVVNGVIDTPKDDTRYADVDEQGRYRVRFLFDTTGPDKGQASKLVRMAQPHSGEGYGMHFPLRAGVEVIITFVDGDPDRPIIAATVPNPQTASPVASGNAPRNIIRTGAGNEINIDDTHDSARIKMSVPHKSTVFQLGAPNSPERGAMLETQGAWSQVATSGIASATSFGASFAAISHFLSSGQISTIAEVPKFAEGVATFGEVAASLLETASAAIEAALAAWEAHVNQLKADSIKAQIDAKDQAKKTEEAIDEACSGEAAVGLTGMDEYQKAAAAIRARYPKNADGSDPPEYTEAMNALLKKPGMAASQRATELAALPKGTDGKVDKSSSAYKTWYAKQLAACGGDATKADKQVEEAEKAAELHETASSAISGYEGRFPSGSTFPATEADYITAYKTANPSSTSSDADIAKLYESDKQARAYLELAEKMKAYKEAQEAYQAGVSGLRNNEEFLRDAIMGGEYTGRTTYQVEGYEKAIEQNKKDLYGDPTASPPQTGLAGALDKARHDLGMGVDANGNPTGGTIHIDDLPPELAASLTDYQTALGDAQTANKLDDTAWKTAAAKKKAYDTELEELEHGDKALSLKEAKLHIDQAKQGTQILFSVLAGAVSLAETLWHKYKKSKKDPLGLWAGIKKSFARSVKEFVESHSTFRKKFVKHTLGSEFNTEVFADNELILKGKNAVKLHSKVGEVRLTAKTTAGLHAEKTAEVSSGGDIQLSCDDGTLDVRSKKTTIITDDTVGITSMDEGIKLKAYGDNVEIFASADLQATALGDIELTAAKKAKVMAGAWGVEIEEGKSVKVGNDAWQLSIMKRAVTLGSKGNGAHLNLGEKKSTLQASSEVKIAASKVAVSAAKVDFGKAQIISDNLLVKGSLDPAVATLQATIEAAQAAADAAAQAAEAASKTKRSQKKAREAALQRAAVAKHKADLALSTAEGELVTLKDVLEG